MNSCIYTGHVAHARLEPRAHRFRYPVYFFGLDLEELPLLAASVRGFGHNRLNLVALHDRDYLDGRRLPIRDKLMEYLAPRGLAGDIARVFLVTSARFLNYVFNPVSFYYCYAGDGSLRCTVAEVNNTFRERHLYVLDRPHALDTATRFTASKAFHVSPFNDRNGHYEFRFSPPTPNLDIRVDLHREGRPAFLSQLAGTARPLTTRELAATLLRYPLTAALTMPRILTQAGHLYFRKKLAYVPKPLPMSDMTIKVAPAGWQEKACMRLLQPVVNRLRRGSLRIIMPDRTARVWGGGEPGTQAELTLHDYSFFARLVRDGEVGLGESFVAGEWDSPDLTAVVRFFIENRDLISHGDHPASCFGRLLNRARHVVRINSPAGSRRNIAAHYDLSNDFFRLLLGPSMLYSSAVYQGPDDTLEAAQQRKVHLLIEKARIAPHHHVLEIGSGWGAFALEAVRRTGCRVTSITISQRQLEEARRRVAEAGLSDRIDLRLCDYRHMEGTFDRIVSIEMLEAVGHDFLGAYFAACDRLLAPRGLLVLQVITMPDQRYEDYRRGVDWIQKHIFPGGHLPSLQAMAAAMTRHSRFVVDSLDNIGVHYARTLRDWRARFLARQHEIKAMGFDDAFARKWLYYLCYCEAAFASRAINNLHLVLTRPGNSDLDETPRGR